MRIVGNFLRMLEKLVLFDELVFLGFGRGFFVDFFFFCVKKMFGKVFDMFVLFFLMNFFLLFLYCEIGEILREKFMGDFFDFFFVDKKMSICRGGRRESEIRIVRDRVLGIWGEFWGWL